MIPWIARGFDQLMHHRTRCRAIRIPHSEVDDVLLIGAQPRPHLIDHGEDVWR